MRRTGLLLGLLVVTSCAFAQAALGFGQVPGSPFATGTGDFGVGVALSADANTVLIGGQDDNSHVGVAWVFTTHGGGQGDGQGVTTFVRKPFVTHGSDVSFTVRCAHATCHDRATETLTETLKGKAHRLDQRRRSSRRARVQEDRDRRVGDDHDRSRCHAQGHAHVQQDRPHAARAVRQAAHPPHRRPTPSQR